MEESEYLRIAETIPLDWYTGEAAKEITSALFYNIMIKTAEDNDLIINDTNDFQKLVKILAEKNSMPEAKKYMKMAIEIFDECGADGWRKNAEKKLRRLSGKSKLP